jgi:hypothetical protein
MSDTPYNLYIKTPNNLALINTYPDVNSADDDILPQMQAWSCNGAHYIITQVDMNPNISYYTLKGLDTP